MCVISAYEKVFMTSTGLPCQFRKLRALFIQAFISITEFIGNELGPVTEAAKGFNSSVENPFD